jgi:CRISPR/Cas system CSM-associated protein Csm4 (group 5 of RAMP superfamily)
VKKGLSKTNYNLVCSKLRVLYGNNIPKLEQLINELDDLGILTKTKNLFRSLKRDFNILKNDVMDIFKKKKKVSKRELNALPTINKLNSIRSITKDFIPSSCRHITNIIIKIMENYDLEDPQKNIMVLFIGGITMMEITVLRLFSKLCSSFNITIVTTNMMNSKSLFELIIDKSNNTTNDYTVNTTSDNTISGINSNNTINNENYVVNDMNFELPQFDDI